MYDTVPNGVQTFEIATTPTWSANTYVFHRDHSNFQNAEAKGNVLCQRYQLTGLCYIHTPAVLQYYLVWLAMGSDVGMIDVSTMVREWFDAEKLKRHIFEDTGGSSRLMLGDILITGSTITDCRIDDITVEFIETWGPLLVFDFEIHDDFLPPNNTFAYTGQTHRRCQRTACHGADWNSCHRKQLSSLSTAELVEGKAVFGGGCRVSEVM